MLCAVQASIYNSTVEGTTLKIFRFGMANDVSTLNPFAAITDNEYIVMDMIYDYIWFPDLYPGWPCLVESGWYLDGITAASSGTDFSNFNAYNEPSDWPLGSIWEYNLTKNVFWNDGTPFTAEDVAWTINIQIGDNWMIYWAFQPSTRWIDHVEKVNDHKVRIFFSEYNSKEPTPIAFGESLMMPVLPKHAFENKVSTYLAFEWNGMPSIGTGPFMGTDKLRDELIAGEMCTLVRNPYYNFIDADGIRKGLGAAYNMSTNIDRVLVKFFADEATLSLAARLGDVDVVQISNNDYINWIQDPTLSEDLNLMSMLSSWQYSREVCFNAFLDAPGILNPLRLDPVVHRAASLATNKSLILDVVYKGLGFEGVGLISPYAEDWWWEPDNDISYFNVTDGTGAVKYSYSKPMKDVMSYDLDEANRILNEAGYYWDGDFRKAGALVGDRMYNLFGIPPSATVDRTLSFDILVGQEVFEDRQIADILIQQWKEVGIKLKESLVTETIWDETVYSYSYEVMITYWSGDLDPNYLCFIPTSYALFGWNEFGTASQEYDQLYDEQVSILNRSERKYYTDKCIKWQYLSGSINTLLYPEKCFAFNEKKWTNWSVVDEPFYSYLYVEYISQEDDRSNYTTIIIVGIVIIAATASIVLTLKIRSRKKREYELFMEETKENEL